MGHNIRAIIGIHKSMQRFADLWTYANVVELPQGYGMIFMTDQFLDEVTELFEVPDEFCYPELDYFTIAADQLLQQYSFQTKLAYVETDYFGGVGIQAGILYENGQICIKPCNRPGIINRLLKELGVRCESNKDEFDSLNLGIYRHMPMSE